MIRAYAKATEDSAFIVCPIVLRALRQRSACSSQDPKHVEASTPPYFEQENIQRIIIHIVIIGDQNVNARYVNIAIVPILYCSNMLESVIIKKIGKK